VDGKNSGLRTKTGFGMTPPSLLSHLIEANQVEFWRFLGQLPRVEVLDMPEALCVFTGIPAPMGNIICRVRLEPDQVDAKIGTLLEPFRSRELPVMWRVGPETCPQDIGIRLLAHGLVDAGEEPGMAVDLSSLPELTPVPALRIESIRDQKSLEKMMEIFAAVFQLADSVKEGIFKLELSMGLEPHLPRQLFIGWLDGEPVATSMLFMGAGVAGLYAVGTLPSARRQGIGKAMTLAPLHLAHRKGYQIGILHASEMGKGVYARIGFKEYCRMHSYIGTG